MTIRLEGIECHAYHGVYPAEKKQGNRFMVDIEIRMPDTRGATTDQLSDTLDYQVAYNLVMDEMAIPSNLIEHVALRIRNGLERLCPNSVVKVRIAKCEPPLGGKVRTASVEL